TSTLFPYTTLFRSRGTDTALDERVLPSWEGWGCRGILPAVLSSDWSAGKMPAAPGGSWKAAIPFVAMNWDHEPTRPRARARPRRQTTESRTRTRTTPRPKHRFRERGRFRVL